MTTSPQLETAPRDAEPRGPKCHLTYRLLARDQQSAAARPNQSIDQLKHERRLADPWLARQQRDSARTRPPPTTRSTSASPVEKRSTSKWVSARVVTSQRRGWHYQRALGGAVATRRRGRPNQTGKSNPQGGAVVDIRPRRFLVAVRVTLEDHDNWLLCIDMANDPTE